jgi:uncharacterized protein (DUF302 family)
MIVAPSELDFAEARRRLLAAIDERELTVFAQIDHAEAAHQVGLELSPEEVVVFGGPRAGTPLMQADPRVGLELPLRILVWEREGGTRLGYNDPLELADRFEVQALRPALEKMSQLLAALVSDAAG